MEGQDARGSGCHRVVVEDTSVFPKVDMLNQSIQSRGTRKTPSTEGDEIDTKLVVTHATYARGLIPWCAGGMLT